MPKSHRRLRVDLFFDSCFASAFVAHFLTYAWSELEDVLSPCTLFAAALPDEYAWEMPKLSHGVFTHAYKTETESPSLVQPRLLLIVKTLWNRWRKREPQRLNTGGVSYITNDAQHSLEYENGFFQLHGAGGFHISISSRCQCKHHLWDRARKVTGGDCCGVEDSDAFGCRRAGTLYALAAEAA